MIVFLFFGKVIILSNIFLKGLFIGLYDRMCDGCDV